MSTHARPGSAFAACLLGVVLGAACQLQQPRLWPLAPYAAASACAMVLLLLALRVRGGGAARWLAVLAAASALSAGVTGWRAAAYAATRLAPALEGRDLLVTGVVAALPHRSDAGLRFRFDAESALAGGQPVRLPPRLMLGWYGGAEAADGLFSLERQPADLRPGERWEFALRLKAPHGSVNPHGFDYELWLWEQGVQATGAVRAGLRDPPP